MNNLSTMINKIIRPCNPAVITLIFGVAVTTGCAPAIGVGTPAQAVLARATITEGQDKVAALGAELSEIINRFAPLHPVTQALIVEPPVEPATPVFASTLSQYYGVFEESTTGFFTKTSDFNYPIIQIKLLNGIDITFQSIVYVAGEISQFQLDIVSDQRSITTPIEDHVTIHLTYTFQKVIAPILNILNPPQDTRGSMTFSRDIAGTFTPVSYQVQRTIGGTVQSGALTTASGSSVRFDEASTGDFWEVNQLVFFAKADPDNTNSPYVGTGVTKIYRDKIINSNVNIYIQNYDQVATTNQSIYAGSGDVLLETSTGQVRVATIENGPITCSVTAPNQTGTGTPIQLVYADKTTTSVMPTAEFNCAGAVR